MNFLTSMACFVRAGKMIGFLLVIVRFLLILD